MAVSESSTLATGGGVGCCAGELANLHTKRHNSSKAVKHESACNRHREPYVKVRSP